MLKYQTINYPSLYQSMMEDECTAKEFAFLTVLSFIPAPHSSRFKWNLKQIQTLMNMKNTPYIYTLRKSLLEKGYLVDLGEGEYKIDRVTFFYGNAPQEAEEDLTVIEPTRKTYVPKEKPEVKPKEEPKPVKPKLSGKEEFNQMLIDMGLGNTSLIQK